MARRTRHPDYKSAIDLAMMGWESQMVIGLRMMKVAAGGAPALLEMQRMVSEKVIAAMGVQTILASAALSATSQSAASRSIKHYRSKVRANHRRLTRASRSSR